MSKHRRRDEQRRLIQEWNESGESAAAFAARMGVSSHTVYRWRAALADASKRRESALAQIVEVRTTTLPTDTRFEIEVGGRRVRVSSSFDEAGLRRLLRVLEGAP
jgi:transposase-like protein